MSQQEVSTRLTPAKVHFHTRRLILFSKSEFDLLNCTSPSALQYRFAVDIMQARTNAQTLLVCYEEQDCTQLPWGYTSTLQLVQPPTTTTTTPSSKPRCGAAGSALRAFPAPGCAHRDACGTRGGPLGPRAHHIHPALRRNSARDSDSTRAPRARPATSRPPEVARRSRAVRRAGRSRGRVLPLQPECSRPGP